MKVFALFGDASAPDRAPRPIMVGSPTEGISVAVILSDGYSMLSLGSISDALSLAGQGCGDARSVRTTLFGFASAQARSDPESR